MQICDIKCTVIKEPDASIGMGPHRKCSLNAQHCGCPSNSQGKFGKFYQQNTNFLNFLVTSCFLSTSFLLNILFHEKQTFFNHLDCFRRNYIFDDVLPLPS